MTKPETETDRPPRVAALSPIRAAIARRMTQSKQQAPHFYVEAELEVDAILTVLNALNSPTRGGERVTVTACLVKAVALALASHPEFNAVWRGEGPEQVEAINVGVAVALDDGLVAPAILDCAGRDLFDINGALRDLVSRTRAGRVRPSELNDPTFTISNLGMYADVSAFTAIITPPQVAILAAARIEPRPVVRTDAVVVRHLMSVTLSADHRAVDGAAAARFLGTLAASVRAPEAWMLRSSATVAKSASSATGPTR